MGSDCDPDRVAYGGPAYDSWNSLRWEGVRQGVATARRLADEVADAFHVPIPITWCVRSDDQMKRLYDDYAWGYKAFAATWEDLAARGDEIAWHAHVWRWDDSAGCWYQEATDRDWMSDCLGRGHDALRAQVGDRLRTSRMGWEFHNDHTMRTVSDLGIANDFSAIPGWYTPGEASVGSRFHCHADWRSTPKAPYRPSRLDYRQPQLNGEGTLDVCEFPMSTFISPFWGGARTVKNAIRQNGPRGALRAFAPGTWCNAQVKAYATIKPVIFNRLIASRLRAVHQSPDGHDLLVTAFHPDELLDDSDGRLYSSASFAANLRAIITRARGEGVEPVFVTVSELGNIHGSEMAWERRKASPEVPTAEAGRVLEPAMGG